MTSRTGLAVALAASITVALLPELPQPAPDRPFTVATTPGNLPDGTPYTPLAFLDDGATLGVAQDAATLKLLLRPPGAPPVTLRALPVAGSPRIIGLTATARATVWAEADAVDTTGVARIWRAGPAARTRRCSPPTPANSSPPSPPTTSNNSTTRRAGPPPSPPPPRSAASRCPAGPSPRPPARRVRLGGLALGDRVGDRETRLDPPGRRHHRRAPDRPRRSGRADRLHGGVVPRPSPPPGRHRPPRPPPPLRRPRLRVGPGLRPAVPDVVLHDRYAPCSAPPPTARSSASTTPPPTASWTSPPAPARCWRAGRSCGGPPAPTPP
ncbi:hypothetical protein ACFQV2_06260 [Actinokineospora soli]|uniref:Uncharacterized protein n=1 Tax=Actinokineospora soli TaxID=1048753 RepID=A0ABW2TKA6_9PSEU